MNKQRTTGKRVNIPHPDGWPDREHILNFITITDPLTTVILVTQELRPTLSTIAKYLDARARGISRIPRKNADSILAKYKREKVEPTPLYHYLKKHSAYKRAYVSFLKKKIDDPCAELTFLYVIALGMHRYLTVKDSFTTDKYRSRVNNHLSEIFLIVKNHNLFGAKDREDNFMRAFTTMGVQLHCEHKLIGKTRSKSNWRKRDALRTVAECFNQYFGQTIPKALYELAPIFDAYEPSPLTIERICKQVKNQSNLETMVLKRIAHDPH